MSNQLQYRTLFAYHWHTNRHLLELAARLDGVDYKESPGYGHGSIHGLFFHLLRTDQSWRMALQTGKQLAPLHLRDYPDLQSLVHALQAEQQDWQTFLDGLSAAEIESDVALTNWRGDTYTIPRWRVL